MLKTNSSPWKPQLVMSVFYFKFTITNKDVGPRAPGVSPRQIANTIVRFLLSVIFDIAIC